MPRPRKMLISLEATSYYHCISRCVRRAFLCGEEALTGRSFEHRRGWIEERLLELAQIFAIEVCGCSIMASYSHIVMHVDQPLAESWAMREVVERWHHLFGGTILSERYLREDELLEVEETQLEGLVETWRERLTSVSWFMRCLNEHIARKANEEDQCTGHFWEGRFRYSVLAIIADAAGRKGVGRYARPTLRLMARTPSQTSHRLPPSHPRYTPAWAACARAGPRGCPSTSPTTWTWSTGPDGRCVPTSAGPSPMISRRSWSASASPQRHGCSWPRTSRPTSAARSVKPSGCASESVSAGRAASAPAGGCSLAERSQLSLKSYSRTRSGIGGKPVAGFRSTPDIPVHRPALSAIFSRSSRS